MHHNVCGPIPPFWGFSPDTPTIPKLYWDVKSQEQRILNIFKLLDKVIAYAESIGMEVDGFQADVDELKEKFKKYENGEFWDVYEQKINAWVDENMPEIIRRVIKFIYFGLTEDGYFCAYIPDSWADIMFDTGAVYGRSDYGRLILRMQADSPQAVDNTYSYSLAQMPDTAQWQADVESATKRSDAAFKTLFTQINIALEAMNGTID